MHFGGIRAIEELTLQVKTGIIMSIIGPNGAGKTTIFNCLTGITKPTKGSVLFSQTDITRLPPHDIARLGIARTFQNIRLFKEMTVHGKCYGSPALQNPFGDNRGDHKAEKFSE